MKSFARNLLSTRLSLIVVCASVLSASTMVLAQAGHLDRTFGANGIFTLSLANSQANVVALQSDGKIVVAGQLGNKSGLIRLGTNGSLDNTFGSGGVVVVNHFGGDINQVIVGLAIQSDGKIVAAATGVPQGGQVARFNTNGTLDTTFGSNGIATLSLNAALLALQTDGKIIVAGGQLGGAVMARLNTNGQPDTTFGTGGVAALADFGSSSIALQADGKILIGSGGFPPLPVLNPLGAAGSVTRYNTNGSLDKTFGIFGQAAATAAPSAIAVQSDGKILTAGAQPAKSRSMATRWASAWLVTIPTEALIPLSEATAATLRPSETPALRGPWPLLSSPTGISLRRERPETLSAIRRSSRPSHWPVTPPLENWMPPSGPEVASQPALAAMTTHSLPRLCSKATERLSWPVPTEGAASR